jgi:hypothetical protein
MTSRNVIEAPTIGQVEDQEASMARWARNRLVCGLAIAMLSGSIPGQPAHGQTSGDIRRASSLEAFARMAPVLQHPRCLNCHSTTQHPTQGHDKSRHTFGVVRGADDKGATGLRCASCHQTQNMAASRVPGAPHWQLAPLSMGWEGKSLKELCRALVDLAANGGRDPAALAKHMQEDPLVQWAWSPGGKRDAPPVGRKEFHDLAVTWADTGAACPD